MLIDTKLAIHQLLRSTLAQYSTFEQCFFKANMKTFAALLFSAFFALTSAQVILKNAYKNVMKLQELQIH